MSAADGIRPVETTTPSITSPGVLMTPRPTISRGSVTWLTSASTPTIATASRALASRRWQLGQPDPRTSIVRMLVSLADQEVEEIADHQDPGAHGADEDGQQRQFDDAPQDHELGQADGGDRHHESQCGAQRHALAAVSYT